MMDAMLSAMEYLMYPLVMMMVVMMVMKTVMDVVKSNKKKEKKKRPRDEDERINIGLERGAKSSTLLKRKDIYVTGDAAVPRHKVGTTSSGLLPGNDEIVLFFRKTWWKFWEPEMMLHIEPELLGDMNTGEIAVKGRGIKPVNENEFYIIPPSHHYQEVEADEVATRRSSVTYTRFMNLLNKDINKDISRSVKESFRGGPEPALAELYRVGGPPKKSRKELEREAEEMEEKFKKKTSSPNLAMQEGDL